MIETIVTLKPPEQWRKITEKRWHSDRGWLNWCRPALRRIWPEERPIRKDEILAELNQKAAIPGVRDTLELEKRLLGNSIQPIETDPLSKTQ